MIPSLNTLLCFSSELLLEVPFIEAFHMYQDNIIQNVLALSCSGPSSQTTSLSPIYRSIEESLSIVPRAMRSLSAFVAGCLGNNHKNTGTNADSSAAAPQNEAIVVKPRI